MTIPSSVTSIDEAVFKNCQNLYIVSLPASITKLSSGDATFGYCSKLTHIYCYAEFPPTITVHEFECTPTGNITLHVPAASIEEYHGHFWGGFGKYVPLTEEDMARYESTDIHSVVADKDVQQIYTLDGRPSQTSQKGVNIIRTNNGKTKKVLVK